jgi:predicted transposase YbfD/YdcC
MCPAQPLSPLIEHFQSLEDPRCRHLVEHRLLDIIGLTLCAVICGADTWVDIAAYGRAKEAWLRGFLSLPHGIPSHDTIARLFAALDPEAFQTSFVEWVKAVAPLGPGHSIAIDGKTLRHSYDRGGSKGAIHMVSAWANEQRLVLAQVKVDEKSNEITAIPELLKVLDLQGCLVTLDAMGTQIAIAQQIIEGGGDYILSLKGNQGNLHEDVKQVFTWARQQQFKDMPHEFHQTITHGHGRLDIRRHWLLGEVEHLIKAERWTGLRQVGLVEAERRILGQPPTIEQRYYLVSFEGNVQRFAQGVRSHWGIENQLHWVLDVAFQEDASRIRKDHAPANLAVVRHIALNLLRQDSSAKGGVKAKRLQAGWDNGYLARLIST